MWTSKFDPEKLKDEQFITTLIQSGLSDPKVREDLRNLISFTSDDDHVEEGSRAAKSWALKLWWRILYKPVIGSFMQEVIDRHNMFWVRREKPLDKATAGSLRTGVPV